MGKESACSADMIESRVQFLGHDYLQEKGMVTESSILAWEIPWREEPGGLQATRLWLQRVGND